MTTVNQDRRHTRRHLAVFSLITAGCGWLGWGVDRLLGSSPSQGLGQLIWLIAPLGTALVFRAFGGDGWQDFGLRPRVKGNGKWYLASILIYPAAIALSIALGAATGLLDIQGAPRAGSSLLTACAAGLLPSFIKNIFEEGAWRGYLAPKLFSLGFDRLGGHVLAGLVWASWHIPYYLVFMDHKTFTAYTTQPLWLFLPFMALGLVACAIVYGEIRILTRSVWPAVLMHTLGNALINPLILQGFIARAPGAELIVSPGPESLANILLFGLIGMGILRYRKRRGEPAAVVAA